MNRAATLRELDAIRSDLESMLAVTVDTPARDILCAAVDAIKARTTEVTDMLYAPQEANIIPHPRFA
jgi:hypothetical protein